MKNMKEVGPFFNQMYDLGNEAYKVVDKDLNIIFCNKKYLEFNKIGFDEDPIGKKCGGFMCSRECGLRECSLANILNGGEISEEILEKKISPTETRYYILNAKPFKDDNGETIGMVECFIDITAMKEAELVLKENEAQLKKINATKDKLISIIAHDLRSPFNSILGFSELLIENIKDLESSEIESFLGNINSSAHNTLTLLDNLLNWVKTQTQGLILNPKEIVLSSLIQDTIDLSSASAKIKDISLNYIQSDEIEIYSDENMLNTILRNLISNAIKFTNVGGCINVSAMKRGEKVEIIVSDDGVGMSEEVRRSIFDISETASTLGTANEKGSGLGLVLCKEFAERLGGDIWVESEEGKGSDFKFSLSLNSLLKEE